jgi:DivIVA domain-containing protein
VTLTPQQVREKQFNTVKMRTGYDMDEVDSFLDEVESALGSLMVENDDLRAQLAQKPAAPATPAEADKKVAEAQKKIEEADKKAADAQTKLTEAQAKLADAEKKAAEADRKLTGEGRGDQAHRGATHGDRQHCRTHRRTCGRSRCSDGGTGTRTCRSRARTDPRAVQR